MDDERKQQVFTDVLSWNLNLERRRSNDPYDFKRYACLKFLQACARLNIDPDFWPGFCDLRLPNDRLKVSHSMPDFSPPVFEVLTDTWDEWERRADESWQQHKLAFKQVMADTSGYNAIKRHRSSGPKRNDIPPEPVRYEWAARHVMLDCSFAEIARECKRSAGAVRQAANGVLELLYGETCRPIYGPSEPVLPDGTPAADNALFPFSEFVTLVRAIPVAQRALLVSKGHNHR